MVLWLWSLCFLWLPPQAAQALPPNPSTEVVPSSPLDALPCLDRSSACVDRLTELAIAGDPRIRVLDERLELLAQRMGRQYERRWSSVLGTLGDLLSLNPFRLLESLFGGGGVRDTDLKLAELEAQTSSLLHQRAAAVAQVRDTVADLVLRYEEQVRSVSLLESEWLAHRQRLHILEVSYRLGEGTTPQMLGLWQDADALRSRLDAAISQRDLLGDRLLLLVGAGENQPESINTLMIF